MSKAIHFISKTNVLALTLARIPLSRCFCPSMKMSHHRNSIRILHAHIRNQANVLQDIIYNRVDCGPIHQEKLPEIPFAENAHRHAHTSDNETTISIIFAYIQICMKICQPIPKSLINMNHVLYYNLARNNPAGSHGHIELAKDTGTKNVRSANGTARSLRTFLEKIMCIMLLITTSKINVPTNPQEFPLSCARTNTYTHCGFKYEWTMKYNI